jgi:Cft2 family RNA processing exonuclease
MRINWVRTGAINLSASGMCEGGRIRHHLRYNLSRPECAIVFVGFQAAGTLGRKIVDGARSVRIFREPYPVRARIFTINGLSAHAGAARLARGLPAAAGADLGGARRAAARARAARADRKAAALEGGRSRPRSGNRGLKGAPQG